MADVKRWYDGTSLKDYDTLKCITCSTLVEPSKLLKKGVKYVCPCCKSSWVIDPNGNLIDNKPTGGFYDID